jgi:hypothetical protein
MQIANKMGFQQQQNVILVAVEKPSIASLKPEKKEPGDKCSYGVVLLLDIITSHIGQLYGNLVPTRRLHTQPLLTRRSIRQVCYMSKSSIVHVVSLEPAHLLPTKCTNHYAIADNMRYVSYKLNFV